MANLDKFRTKVQSYLREGKIKQETFAAECGYNAQYFSGLLNNKEPIDQSHVHTIIKNLAKTRLIDSQEQARELIQLMGSEDFTTEWMVEPLSRLRNNPGSTFQVIKTVGNTEKQVQQTVTTNYTDQRPISTNQFNINQDFALVNVYREPRRRACPVPESAPVHFAGRDKELAELMTCLQDSKTSAITAICGIGGVGKTSLAHQIAFDFYQAKLCRAVLWAEVTPNPNPVTVLETWAKLIDPSFTLHGFNSVLQLADYVRAGLNELIAEKCQECEPPRVLLVLDDVWENGIDSVALLKRAAPLHHITLVTTRTTYVPIRLGASHFDLKPFAAVEGATVLKEYLTWAEARKLQKLSLVLGGHALALALAAIRLQLELEMESKSETIVDEHIGQYEEAIKNGTPFDDLELELGQQKNENLSVSLYLSYAGLQKEEQRAFRALGALPNNIEFDELLLSSIWDKAKDGADLKLLRKRMILSSLIETVAEKEGWYTMHPLLQAYAHSLLRQAGEESEVKGTYFDRVIELTDLFRKLQPEDWDKLVEYLPHIMEAGDKLVEKAAGYTTHRALQFANNITLYLSNRREVQRISWLEMGLGVSRQQQNPIQESLFLHEIGSANRDYGNPDKALVYFYQALDIRRKIDDKKGEANTLNNIGSAYDILGDKTKALDFHEQALYLFRAVEDKSGEAKTLNNLGSVHYSLGDTAQALEFFYQASLLSGEVGDKRNRARTLNNVGLVYDYLGDNIRALEYYNQSLPILEVVGDKAGIAATLNNIGRIYDTLGDSTQALNYYNQSLPLSRSVGDNNGYANTLNNIGEVYYNLGNSTQALNYYQQALPLFQEVGDKSGEAVIYHNIASLYYKKGWLEEAIKYLSQCIDIRTQIQSPDLASNQVLLIQWQQEIENKPL